MPWLLDGNNLAGGGDRSRVRRAALAVARQERVRIVVLFDGAPPPGSSGEERLGRVEVEYVPDADTAIIARLRRGARGWRVATDDRRLATAAKAAGAEVVPAAAFWQKAEAVSRGAGGEGRSATGLDEELAFLSDRANRLPQTPARVPRRKPHGPGRRR